MIVPFITPGERSSQRPTLINDVIAAVDVKCLAGDQPSRIVSEERGGNAHVIDADEAPCRRFRLRLFQ